jgi:hypothetical protein
MALISRVPAKHFTALQQLSGDDPARRPLRHILNELIDMVNAGTATGMTQEVACLPIDAVGDWMCVRGDRVNGKWRVERADPYAAAKMPAIGVLISKSTPTVGVLQLTGAVRGVWGALDWSKPLAWLGAIGIQYTPPGVGSHAYVLAQPLGKAVAADVFWITGSLTLIKQVA